MVYRGGGASGTGRVRAAECCSLNRFRGTEVSGDAHEEGSGGGGGGARQRPSGPERWGPSDSRASEYIRTCVIQCSFAALESEMGL